MHDERERFLIPYAGGFAPFTVARADGAWIETTDGRRILDFTSGQICSTLGHNHPDQVVPPSGRPLDRFSSRELQSDVEQIGDVRGRGLLVGVELVNDRESRAPAEALGLAVTDECLARGLSMNIVRSGSIANCLRIAPPLTVTEAEIDLAAEIMGESLRAVLDRDPALARA